MQPNSLRARIFVLGMVGVASACEGRLSQESALDSDAIRRGRVRKRDAGLLDGNLMISDAGSAEDSGLVVMSDANVQESQDAATAVDTGIVLMSDAGIVDAGTMDAVPPPSTGQGCPSLLPSGWLFCDDFESGDLARWTEQDTTDPGRLEVVNDASNSRSGSHALYLPSTASSNYLGGYTDWRPWPTGYQELHIRVWMKLAEDFRAPHHFLWLGAARRDDRWSADGLAGCRPTGENFVAINLDLWTAWGATPQPGRFALYTYWPDMTCDPGNRCATYADPVAICAGCAQRNAPCLNGLECCWGNLLEPAEPRIPERSKWVCVEYGARLNDIGSSNGSEWFALDGRGYRKDDMRMRTSDILELNSVRIGMYNTPEDSMGHSSRIWFDDVVIATQPIGCE